jgi:hypothetical protein
MKMTVQAGGLTNINDPSGIESCGVLKGRSGGGDLFSCTGHTIFRVDEGNAEVDEGLDEVAEYQRHQRLYSCEKKVENEH